MTVFEYIVLLLTLLSCLSIIWSSLRTGITPVPSSRKARQAILASADQAPAGAIIELGSGWGTLALALAKKFPERQVIGYEISLIPWLISLLFKQIKGAKNLRFRRKNFLTAQLPEAALLVCYLYPDGMNKLAEKLEFQKSATKMLISNTFSLPGKEAIKTIRLDDLYKTPIYVYQIASQVRSGQHADRSTLGVGLSVTFPEY